MLITSFLSSISDTRFSASVLGGNLSGNGNVGEDHPTNLGDGVLDSTHLG